jgi:hypothetical protein
MSKKNYLGILDIQLFEYSKKVPIFAQQHILCGR